jgi:hypothetical protein
MTVREFYDYLIKHMTPEEALLKLLEGLIIEYENLKFSSDENSVHPILLIVMAAMDMGWEFAISNPEGNLDADVQGMIIGTKEYVDSVLKNADVNNSVKLIEPNGQYVINFNQ